MKDARLIKRISVSATLSSIPVGDERTIDLNDISLDTVRATIFRLNRKGFKFSSRVLRQANTVVVKRHL